MTDRPLTYLRSAIRSLRRTPGLSLAAIASLALGIGANAAIFAAFNQSLLQRLPIHDPEQLVTLSAPGDKNGRVSASNSGRGEAVFSYPLFRDLERGQRSFTALAAHRDVPANVAHRGQTSNGLALLVSGSYFPVLGVQPALGRLLSDADDQTIGAHRVVVLSHAFWRSRFASDPSILNDTITINGEPMTVVGVAPQGFHGTTPEDSPEVFVPLTMSGALHTCVTGAIAPGTRCALMTTSTVTIPSTTLTVDQITMTVEYDHEHQFVGPLMNLFGGGFGTIRLRATATMRRE